MSTVKSRFIATLEKLENEVRPDLEPIEVSEMAKRLILEKQNKKSA